jgi:hypothetical protein
MKTDQEVGTRKRRSSAEVKRLVIEFQASGLRQSEFCLTRGIAPSTLRRHVKKHGADETEVKAGTRFAAVELAGADPKRNARTACALEVVLSSGRRIEVRREFDSATLSRVVKVLEGL